MVSVPRLALAVSPTGTFPVPASLAMLAGLTAEGWRVQHFRTRARPFGTATVHQASGLPERHLDSWLMPCETLREVFLRGARRADLSIVEGTFDETTQGLGPYPYDRPGPIRAIADGLGLPVVVVVDGCAGGTFHLPPRPPRVDAVIIDNLRHISDYDALKRTIELVWKRPVLGGIERLTAIRLGLETLGDRVAPAEWIAGLGASFRRTADLAAIRRLAAAPPLHQACEAPTCGRRRFRVAYAVDDAFGGYFPDTLETLEALGAELVEFSPLRDESLPESVDLVMFGCGFPDKHADALAANFSLIGTLREHVCRGHRIYSEGGGTAYLGRSLIIDGRRIPMAGILPFEAELRKDPRPPLPVTRTLSKESWLGPAGTVLRGYRSGRWRLHPADEPDDCPARSGVLTASRDVCFRHHAVGSLIHVHLAAFPDVVAAFTGRTSRVAGAR